MGLDRDGQVWVATLRGVSVFPPPEQGQRPVVTTVVDDIAVDGRSVPLGSTVQLGPGRRDLMVSYTTATFLGHGRLLFRHQLVGWDADWVTAGTPAVAHYRDLPAGHYTLRLAAGGPAAKEAAVTELTIVCAPPWWRSRWFLTTAMAATVTALLIAHLVRLAQVRLHARAVSEERARIARDLHDGIAQKLTAIGLLTDGERGQLRSAQSGGALGQVREIVGEAQAELRRAIWDLREEMGSDQRLEPLIERVVGQVEASPHTTITLATAGDSLRVNGLCAHETPLLVKEALTNAVRHSGARRIEIGLLSDADALYIWVKDDGKGFGSEQVIQERRGHGLVGMYERARRLGGTLRINSRPGRGTEVSLHVKRVSPASGS
jgi:signal transduction histidine kinase